MIEDMGLSGVALRVYALIYSFTKAGSDCHGSIDYICKRVGASYKSVQLALQLLVEKGYVAKTSTKPKSPSIYVAITDSIGKNYRCNESKLPIASVKSTDNNKENNKEILTNYDIFDGS